jgi:hypothetical protein
VPKRGKNEEMFVKVSGEVWRRARPRGDADFGRNAWEDVSEQRLLQPARSTAVGELTLNRTLGVAPSFPSIARLSLGHMLLHSDEAVRGHRDRIDAAVDEKFGELRMIARSLPA